jgi:hypothetical protein
MTTPKQHKKKATKKVPLIPGTNKLDFNEEQIESLASRFWNNSEIAAFYGVDEGTIRRRFPNLLIKGKEKGRGRLKDAQLKLALSGNATMLIWLGKQHLEQSDKQQTIPDPNALPKTLKIEFV